MAVVELQRTRTEILLSKQARCSTKKKLSGHERVLQVLVPDDRHAFVGPAAQQATAPPCTAATADPRGRQRRAAEDGHGASGEPDEGGYRQILEPGLEPVEADAREQVVLAGGGGGSGRRHGGACQGDAGATGGGRQRAGPGRRHAANSTTADAAGLGGGPVEGLGAVAAVPALQQEGVERTVVALLVEPSVPWGRLPVGARGGAGVRDGRRVADATTADAAGLVRGHAEVGGLVGEDPAVDVAVGGVPVAVVRFPQRVVPLVLSIGNEVAARGRSRSRRRGHSRRRPRGGRGGRRAGRRRRSAAGGSAAGGGRGGRRARQA
mmetsp:Transcript_46405/g.129244  ORF Transcript_46405/g.129244 Transcript_46405/m.129244 type:complete len:322 (+) Transcript_46405:254-1219(+)